MGILLNFLKEIFTNVKTSIGNFTKTEIEDIIERVIPKIDNSFYTDALYQKFTFKQLKDFIERDETSKKRFIPDVFDCDNYAFLLYVSAEMVMPGCPLGVVFVRKTDYNHAMNCFIDDKNNFYLIEPQTDKIIDKIPDGWDIYFVLI